MTAPQATNAVHYRRDGGAKFELASGGRSSLLPAGCVRCLVVRGLLVNRGQLIGEEALPEAFTDQQVVATLYERYGLGAARRLYGSLAWILWDGRQRRLVAVRDRAGLYGIYYRETGETVAVAAEIEALLEGGARAALNPRAVVAQVNGHAPPPGETHHEAIAAVPPAGLLVVDPRRLAIDSYWQSGPRPLLRLASDLEYAAAFDDVLNEVARDYLPALGPLGITLSTGLDSTSLLVAVRRAVPEPPTAVVWATPELPESDEGPLATRVAGELECPVVAVRADQHWPLRGELPVPRVSSPWGGFYEGVWEATFRAASRHGLRVLLTGVGGDHLFGGNVYSYPDLLLTGRWRRLGSELREHRRLWQTPWSRLIRAQIVGPIARAWVPAVRSRPQVPVPWLVRERTDLIVADPPPIPRLLPGRQQRLRMLRDSLLAPAVEEITVQAARHGIELRHPLLDHRLFELAARLPTDQTFRSGVRKIVVRNAMRGSLPAAVVDRHDKIYPDAIVHRGLRERERDKVWSLMSGMRSAELGYVDEPRLHQAYRGYLAGETRSAMFWHSLTLEAWLRRYG